MFSFIWRANRKLAARAPAEHDRWAARAAVKSGWAVAWSLRHSSDLRDQRILAQDRAFFIPRLCFGVLLVLGTTYVFAPFGLKSKLTCELEPFAITSATELVAALPSMPACVTAKLGDAPTRAAERLATDARVDKIRQWLAGAQG